VWVQFRGHTSNKIKNLVHGGFNTDVLTQGGFTSKLHPVDMSWNKPFKQHLHNSYDEWMFSGEKSYTWWMKNVWN